MPPLPLPQGWTAGDVVFITAAGVVAGALVGAAGAFAVALVNAWNARRMARDAARRELTAKRLQPYADKINERVGTCHKVLTVGSKITAMVGGAKESGEIPEPETEALLALGPELLKLVSEVYEQHRTDYDPGMMSHGDQKLIDVTALWIGSVGNFVKRAGEVDFMKMKPEEAAELRELVSKAAMQGAIVLAVMQEVIVGRTWVSKTWYRTKRRLGFNEIRL
jgi:hypothetical protein